MVTIERRSEKLAAGFEVSFDRWRKLRSGELRLYGEYSSSVTGSIQSVPPSVLMAGVMAM
jgi:hypothetical protein